MARISTEKLLERAGGKYTLLQMVFQRNRQLTNGMPAVIKTQSRKNGMIALEEIAAGKVRLASPEGDENEPAE